MGEVGQEGGVHLWSPWDGKDCDGEHYETNLKCSTGKE